MAAAPPSPPSVTLNLAAGLVHTSHHLFIPCVNTGAPRPSYLESGGPSLMPCCLACSSRDPLSLLGQNDVKPVLSLC